MDGSRPLFVQISEIIENDIISGVYQTDDLIISTTQISKVYSVNPATDVRAVSRLSDSGVLYKKRGIGMCVAAGAKEKIKERRREVFLDKTVGELLFEAELLGIGLNELIDVIKSKEEEKSL